MSEKVDFRKRLESYLDSQELGVSDQFDLEVLAELNRDYEVAQHRAFGDSLKMSPELLTEEKLSTDAGKQYLEAKEIYDAYVKQAPASGSIKNEHIDEIARYSYLEIDNQMSYMEQANKFIRESELDFAVGGVENDMQPIEDLGDFKAYQSFEDALRENYMLDFDQVLEDDPSLSILKSILNDEDTFEEFKEAYLVNMSETNQIRYENRNEPVLFARLNYVSETSLPNEHFIPIKDIYKESFENDVLIDKLNEVFQEASLEIIKVDGEPVKKPSVNKTRLNELEM